MTDKQFILNNTRLGFEFEFFTDFDVKELPGILAKALDKKIVVPEVIKELNRLEIPNHTEFTPDDKTFKLERDFSGGFKMFELITGPLDYQEAIVILKKFNDWVDKYGWTTERSGIHINMSIKNHLALGLRYDIVSMNRLKFCLSFEEELVYKLFPKRKGNVYARSVKTIYPAYSFLLQKKKGASYKNYITPSTKYFGVNFLKQEKNYLEFRYIGGVDYQKQTEDIHTLIDHFIFSVRDTLANPQLNDNDNLKLNEITKPLVELVDSFGNYERFVFNHPEIYLFVDLKSDEQIIKTYYDSTLRYAINELILNGGMKKGYINYDTELGEIQVKNADLKNLSKNEKLFFYECNISGGLMNDNKFYSCKIKNCIIDNSAFFGMNELDNCKIKDSDTNLNDKFKNSYFEIKNNKFSGEFEKCIFRHDPPSESSKVVDCLNVADEIKKYYEGSKKKK